MAEDLVKKKLELLHAQKAKADRLHALLNAPGGFNETSRKTCKNLEAAITASKRPGYFQYYEPSDEVKNVVRSGEVERLQEQLLQLQKQIDQLTDKINSTTQPHEKDITGTENIGSTTSSPNSVHNLQQWFATYGTPKQTSSDQYTSFTPDKKVYGGTTHYSAFKSQSSTMKKGRLTK